MINSTLIAVLHIKLKLLQLIFNSKKCQTQAISTNLDNNNLLLLFLLDLLDSGVQPLIEPDLKLGILFPTSILHQSINLLPENTYISVL